MGKAEKENNKNEKIKQSFGSIVRNNLYLLGKIGHYSPQYIFWMIVEGVIWGLVNSAETIYLVKLFDAIDGGVPFFGKGGAAQIIMYMALFYTFSMLFDRWYWIYFQPLLKNILFSKLQRELFEKARTMDLSCYDDPKYYDDFVWAMNEADSRAIKVCDDVGKIINRVVASFTIFTVMFAINRWISLILLVTSLLNMFLWMRGDKIDFQFRKELQPINRRSAYINRVFHLSDYAKEIRTSDATQLLMDQYEENRENMVDTQVEYGKKFFILYGIFYNILSSAVYYGVIIFMLFVYFGGGVKLGGFAASVNVCYQVRWLIYDLCQRFTKFPEHSLYIEKYLEFLRHEPKIKNGVKPAESFESLEIKNVWFAYENVAPETEDAKKIKAMNANRSKYTAEKKEALRNVSLSIKRGDKVAFVGYNGAGKTTMIKLIMRLYDVGEGQILYNGTDIRELDTDNYRSHIGAVFQDFKLFAATIAENVMGSTYSEADRDTVIRALDAADFGEKLSELRDGIDTHLTREFKSDGTNLSGGEGQKVAIARVFARPYELIIMDESSSALDPIAEYTLNHSILEMASDKTIIFISHRLSTTRMADKIFMFSDGEIIERGSHDELMAQDGKYAEMFNLQAKKYSNSEIA